MKIPKHTFFFDLIELFKFLFCRDIFSLGEASAITEGDGSDAGEVGGCAGGGRRARPEGRSEPAV